MVTVADSNRPKSVCSNCGKRIVGYEGTLSGDTVVKRISVWFDLDTDSPACAGGGDHTPSQHPVFD